MCSTQPSLCSSALFLSVFFFFFFQAEDGIRDTSVTGVQTCALPILRGRDGARRQSALGLGDDARAHELLRGRARPDPRGDSPRSEERRVGKEGRVRGWREKVKKRERYKEGGAKIIIQFAKVGTDASM